MCNYGIEFSKDSVMVYGPGGASTSDPYQGFIEFLYAGVDEIDTVLNSNKDKSHILREISSRFMFFPILLWGIYRIDHDTILNCELKEKILQDLKESQSYFYEQARIFLDENPPAAFHEFSTLLPKERYCKYNSVITSIKCSFLLDEDSMEVIERFYPQTIFEVCYIFFIKMIIKNSTIKKCGHCGKFFEKRLGYNNEYCNRPIPGKNKTCKDIGAMEKYRKESIDDIQKTYKKHYGKVYAYCKRKGLNRQFPVWLDHASELRELARSTNMSIDCFNKRLNEIENEVIYSGGI